MPITIALYICTLILPLSGLIGDIATNIVKAFVIFTIFSGNSGNFWLLLPMIIAGSIIGYYVAKKVEMTEMPQLVAALHSFVGLAAVFIGFNAQLELALIENFSG